MTTPLADRSRLPRLLDQVLDQELEPGEAVHVVLVGRAGQALVGTDRRVLVHPRPSDSTDPLISWEYRDLVGIQLHFGRFSGRVVLQGPGQRAAAANGITLPRQREDAETAVARLRQLAEAAHRSVGFPPPAHPAPLAPTEVLPSIPARPGSPVEELSRLADLHAAGLLTGAEFNRLKARVIGQRG